MLSRNRTILLALMYFILSGISFAQQEQQRVDQAIGASAQMTAPVLLSKSDLENCPYSLISDTRFEGTTEVHAVIDSAGHATNVTVASSSGSSALDQDAVACLQRAHFQPAVHDGKLVNGEFQIGVKWELPPSASTCSPSMPVAWLVTVSVTPAPGSPALPTNADALVCICMNRTELTEPVILRSSGSQRFDDGAMKLLEKSARRSNGWAGCYAERFRFIPQVPGEPGTAPKQ